jgi:hypothetical protein
MSHVPIQVLDERVAVLLHVCVFSASSTATTCHTKLQPHSSVDKYQVVEGHEPTSAHEAVVI